MGLKSTLRLMRTIGPSPASLAQSSLSLLSNALGELDCITQSDIQVKSYGCLNFPRTSMFNFKSLNILFALIRHPSQKLCPFEFNWCIFVEFWTSRYSMGHNQTSQSKVMSFEFVKGFPVQFRASRYIIGLNRRSESKVMASWTCSWLPCWILSTPIYHGP